MGLAYFVNFLIIVFLYIVLFVMAGIAWKKKRKIFVLMCFLVGTSIFFFMMEKSGVFTQTGTYGNTFTLVGNGTGSMGSCGEYEMDREGILAEKEEISRGGFMSMDIKFGWKFCGVQPGTCNIIYHGYECGGLARTIVYRITVDDALEITAEEVFYIGDGRLDGQFKIAKAEEEKNLFYININGYWDEENAECVENELKYTEYHTGDGLGLRYRWKKGAGVIIEYPEDIDAEQVTEFINAQSMSR